MGRRPLHVLGRLGMAAVAAVVFLLSAYFAFNLFVRRGVTAVPELVGLSEDEARALAADQGLALRRAEGGTRYDPTLAAGKVVEVRPRAGSLVKRGSAIAIVVSLGNERLPVPDLAGQALQAAQVTLSAQGLALGRTFNAFGAGAPGAIVAQSPAPGELVARSRLVDVVVALDGSRESYVMPDLIYQRYEPIRAFFERQGFRMGSVKFEPYEGIPNGVVLRQVPLPGHPVGRADLISLVVAGPAPGGA
jgi:serine/threonine-protein kinase